MTRAARATMLEPTAPVKAPAPSAFGHRGLRLAAFGTVCAFWGLNFVAVKVSLRYADPLFLTTVRMLLTGGILLAIARAGRSPLALGRRDLPALAAFATFNCFGLMALMYDAQRHVSAGLGGIILYTYPVITALGARLLLAEHLGVVKTLGIGCGFAGVALVAGFGSGSPAGELEMSGAAVCWAIGTLLFKRYLTGYDIYVVSGWAFLLAGSMSAVSLVATGSFSVRPTAALWLWLAYSVIGATVITNALWLQLLKREGAAVATAQLFMTPLFSLLFGWLLLSEHAGISQLGGAALVAAGIVLVNRGRRRQSGSPDATPGRPRRDALATRRPPG